MRQALWPALLLAHAAFGQTDNLGATPLHNAVWDGRADLVKDLIARGADVNARHSGAGSTPLDFAVLRGDTNITTLLLHAGAKPDPAALRIAAARTNTDIVRMLIDAGADPKASLDEAAQHGSKEVAALLIEKGAEITPSAIDKAAAAGNYEVVVLLLAHSPPDRMASLLEKAVLKGDAALVRILAGSVADVTTPLHDAALKGYAEIAVILIENGAKVNARETDSGATPIYEAASMGREDVVSVLLAHGADPNIPNKSGHGALHAATTNGFTATAERLRSHGAVDDPYLARIISSGR